MRVLIAASTFPADLNDGTPRFVYDLAESLTSHADVTVLAPDTPGAARHERLGSVDVQRFGYFPRRWQRLAPAGGRGMRENFRDSWLAKLQLPSFLARQAAAIRTIVRRDQIDVVNAHWMIPQGVTAAWALRRMNNVKLVLHVHAGDVYLLRKLPLGRHVARYVINRTDAVFADGSHVRDTLDQLLGRPSHAVLQPMGVHGEIFSRELNGSASDLDEATVFPDGFILFVGRLVEKKGTIYLVQALRKIAAQNPRVGLVIVGSGPEEGNIRREVDGLGLHERVKFAGSQPHSQVVKYLHQCRLAVVPSIIDRNGETEGMPTVVVEAMAAGVRVVGSAVNGIPDVIRHAENGWLCREKDPQDLAEKVLTALQSPAKSSMIESALRTAEKYEWRQVAQNYMNCLSRLTLQPEGSL